MILYQLVATGFLVSNGQRVARYSKRIFNSNQEAMEYKERFSKHVTRPRSVDDVSYINPESLSIMVVKLTYEPNFFEPLIDLTYWMTQFSR